MTGDADLAALGSVLGERARARTCYDHLAGRLGVELMQSLIAEQAIVGGDGRHRFDGADRLSAPGRDVDYRLTGGGARKLAALGVDAATASTGPSRHTTSPARSGARSPTACSSSAGSAGLRHEFRLSVR
jgi:hypothetical protein